MAASSLTYPRPLWGVYTRSCAPMMRLPDDVPDTMIYFALGGAPHLDESIVQQLAAFAATAGARDRIEPPSVFGAVIRVDAEHGPLTRPLSRDQAFALEAAFLASRALEGPILEVQANLTGEYNEYVSIAGFSAGRPFQVSYTGTLPYRLLGADADPWQDLVATLHSLTDTP
jgi:hypothetical protein